MHDPSNHPFADRPAGQIRDVVERFRGHAASHPRAVALIMEGRSWDYAQLDTASEHLAHHLRSIGVAAESFVCLYLPRSFAQVAAILAVLKAGGAYVPIDTDYPEERVRLILDDCGAKFLMVAASGPTPAIQPGIDMVIVDDHVAAHPESRSEPLARLADPDDAA
jgi:non-ribosomal peptide synthetase component F